MAAAGGTQRKGSPSFEFLVAQLREEPTLSYGELKLRSEANDFKIAPIMYGRAKALLGLVPVRPRGQGKNRKPAAPAVPPPAGLLDPATLPPSQSGSADQFAAQIDSVRDIEDLVRIVKDLDAERRRLRMTLEQVAHAIHSVLR
ncbi:MAG: hypothetical protein AB8H80_08830 [Planctomycetota bacterium]